METETYYGAQKVRYPVYENATHRIKTMGFKILIRRNLRVICLGARAVKINKGMALNSLPEKANSCLLVVVYFL